MFFIVLSDNITIRVLINSNKVVTFLNIRIKTARYLIDECTENARYEDISID